MRTDSDKYRDEPYHEERYDPTDERPHGGDTGRGGGRGRRFPALPLSGWGWWPSIGSQRRAEREEYGDRDRDRTSDVEAGRELSERSAIRRFWDEGLIALLIVGGLVLFLIPEPATSGLGVMLMGLGVLAWVIDWAT